MIGHPMRSVPLIAALAAACSSSGASLDGYVKIDDMENGGKTIEWLPPDGPLAGVWVTTTDCTEVERISPPPEYLGTGGWFYAELPAPYETFSGVHSTHAARLRTTSPLTSVWGASMGFDLGPTPGGMRPTAPDGVLPVMPACPPPDILDYPGMPVDLSAYRGLTFWAMAGGGERTLEVQIQDLNVDPRAGICNAADPRDETDCYNHFRTPLVLTDTMTRYTVDFSAMQQNQTWGYRPNPDVPDLQRVYAIWFEVDQADCGQGPNMMCAGGSAPPLALDVWIDDLYFVKK